ncbi:hypothetical protein PENSPDRAFT_659110 [Peniophora sp. CONT]|nr:hypothetical protein PENSPDRAFT_659110 [Peniophora sp. CONT]
MNPPTRMQANISVPAPANASWHHRPLFFSHHNTTALLILYFVPTIAGIPSIGRRSKELLYP